MKKREMRRSTTIGIMNGFVDRKTERQEGCLSVIYIGENL